MILLTSLAKTQMKTMYVYYYFKKKQNMDFHQGTGLV